jgi:hypothetical protein
MFQSALRASWDHNVPRLGASLAYYTLFAIASIDSTIGQGWRAQGRR